MDKILFSHPTGNANVRAAVKGLENAGLLQSFHTSIAAFPGNMVNKLAKGPLADLKRRSYDAALAPHTKMWPLYEAVRMVASKAKLRKLTAHEKGIFSVDGIYRYLDKNVAKTIAASGKDIRAVYSYEDGAYYNFAVAKKLGISCLYDLPIGYWRSMHVLLETEKEKYPDWAATLTGFSDSVDKLARKDEELRLADHIFVASSFTRKTLESYPGKLADIHVIPYGFPDPPQPKQYAALQGRKLKLLFVGGLSQRKGIANLIEAMQGLEEKVELTIVGQRPVDNCIALNNALQKHKWIPSLPHEDILKLMREQDIFVFPSLFEGFGLVITEAMSQGTPVITTERTAGPDLIQHGENGWLVNAGATMELKNTIEGILSKPTSIRDAGSAARETAARRPWNIYSEELAAAIKKV